MKKKVLTMMLVVGMTMAAGMTAYAGQWLSDAGGWWYQNDDGSYPTAAWQWIDGNGDGTAECYYFNEAGYMVTNADIDGNTVNELGVWVVDGVTQTQSVTPQAEAISSGEEKPVKATLFDLEPTTSKYWKKDKNTELTTGDNWEVAMRMTTCYLQPYATYELDGQYSALTFDACASSGTGENGISTLEIYGDDDELLYSETYAKGESTKRAVIDISGQDHIRFIGGREGSLGMSGSVLFRGLELR